MHLGRFSLNTFILVKKPLFNYRGFFHTHPKLSCISCCVYSAIRLSSFLLSFVVMVAHCEHFLLPTYQFNVYGYYFAFL